MVIDDEQSHEAHGLEKVAYVWYKGFLALMTVFFSLKEKENSVCNG